MQFDESEKKHRQIKTIFLFMFVSTFKLPFIKIYLYIREHILLYTDTRKRKTFFSFYFFRAVQTMSADLLVEYPRNHVIMFSFRNYYAIDFVFFLFFSFSFWVMMTDEVIKT